MSSTNVDMMRPTNPLVTSLLTDFYQITMAYAYWKAGRTDDDAVFDLFFRKSPFEGEFTIFAGLSECLAFLSSFKFSEDEIEFIRTQIPHADEGFFDYLRTISCRGVSVYAIPEGTVVFPKVPLMRVQGPLAVVQLLETTFLTLVNYASLVTTNAARFRKAAGARAMMLEFGLRRAQGPDGALSAARYTYIGGFDATSNVLAGKMFGIPISGTHAHAFVSSFMSFDDVQARTVAYADGSKVCEDFVTKVKEWSTRVSSAWQKSPQGSHLNTNASELASFTAYAIAFPRAFLALVDTYDVLRSGTPNFIIVALALHELGYVAKGIRLDSGDLAYQSREARSLFKWAGQEFGFPALERMTIVASNDINEATLHSLNAQGHSIDAYGVGTHLVTCQAQPALGCVYKLVEVNGQPRIKLSADVEKVTMPGKKNAFRLYGADGRPICDLLQLETEEPPRVGEPILIRHPFQEGKRARVRPTCVLPLYNLVFSENKITADLPDIHALRKRVQEQIASLREDHVRALNPTPYKVSVSDDLYQFIHKLWLESAPIGELS